MQYQGLIFASALSLGITGALAAAPDVQDHTRTPGASDPAVTQSNISQNICVSGYTGTIRPDTATTNAIKERQLQDWGYRDKNMAHYEEDHLISLQLGGAAEDVRNLWPEPYASKWGARIKDTLEGELRRRVCSDANDPDHITLQEAQAAISKDWKEAYQAYVCKRHKPKLTAIIKDHCALY
jgi:hypothetical protein